MECILCVAYFFVNVLEFVCVSPYKELLILVSVEYVLDLGGLVREEEELGDEDFPLKHLEFLVLGVLVVLLVLVE